MRFKPKSFRRRLRKMRSFRKMRARMRMGTGSHRVYRRRARRY